MLVNQLTDGLPWFVRSRYPAAELCQHPRVLIASPVPSARTGEQRTQRCTAEGPLTPTAAFPR